MIIIAAILGSVLPLKFGKQNASTLFVSSIDHHFEIYKFALILENVCTNPYTDFMISDIGPSSIVLGSKDFNNDSRTDLIILNLAVIGENYNSVDMMQMVPFQRH